MERFRWRPFPIGRCTRGRIIGLLIFISAAKFWADFFAFGRLQLTLNLGFASNALSNPSDYPPWYVAAEAAFALALAYMAVGRLHDISRSGWWLALIASIAYAADPIGLPALALLSLPLWLALIFWPPAVGPNRYGADPRGWQSRDHYEAQRAALRPLPQDGDQAAER